MTYDRLQFVKHDHQRIEQYLEIAIESAMQRAALDHLALWKKELAQYNLKRHPVKIVAYNGKTPTLYIGAHVWFEYRPGHPLTDLLISIGGTIDSAPWAHHLIGEFL